MQYHGTKMIYMMLEQLFSSSYVPSIFLSLIQVLQFLGYHQVIAKEGC